MPLTPGSRLGPYEIIDALDAGGMGEVYRAHDSRLRRDVAIKILPLDVATDPHRRHRFETEARAAAAINHPGIVVLYDIGTDGDVTFIVTELLEGRTLRRLLRDEQLSVHQAVALGAEIADGLAAAHARGVVHRDLKPENLFVTAEGHVKILDFGLAKFTAPSSADEPTASVTDADIVLGTAGYMAPEQVRGVAADYRADIFAFGVVWYEMLSGRRAFAGETAADRRSAVLHVTPMPLAASPERQYPPLLRLALERCLKKTPEERFQSTTDLAFTLKGLLHDGLYQPPAAASAGRRDRSSQWLPWTIAAICLVGAVSLLVRWRPWTTVRPPAKIYRLVVSLGNEEFQTGPAWDHFALSPDGTRLTYAARPFGSTSAGRLYLRRLDQPDAHPIAGTEGAARPFFSPDGDWIVFNADRVLKKVSLDGSPPVTLATDMTNVGGSWGPDGLVLGGGVLGGVPGALGRLPATGGTVSAPIAVHDPTKGELTYRHPQALPDGSVLFTIVTIDRRFQVAVLPRQGAIKVLVENGTHPRYVPPGFLVFARGSTLLVAPFDLKRLHLTGPAVPMVQGVRGDLTGGQSNFSVSADGSLAYIPGKVAGPGPSSLVSVNRQSGRQTPLAFSQQLYRFISVSPDDRQLAVMVQHDDGRGGVLIGDLARGTLTPLADGEGTNVESAYGLSWSADGREVLYRKSDRTLWSARADQSAPEHQRWGTTAPPGDTTGVLSPDGKSLMMGGGGSDPRLGQDIWEVTSTGVRPWLQTPASESPAAFSPDGRWLAYSSNVTKPDDLYVRPFPGPGPVVRVTTSGAAKPFAWSGKELIFQHDGAVIASIVETQPPLTVGAAKTLFKIPPGLRFAGATHDGQRLLFWRDYVAQPDPPPTEIVVIVNWIEEVQQRMKRRQ
jgi:Tol biopolymer transport system component